MKFLVAALATFASVAAGTPIPWTDCSTNALIHVNTLDATPWPPVEGQDLSLKVDAVLDEAITEDATYSITAKVFGVKVFSQEGKLADLDAPAGTFPVPAGEFERQMTEAIPSLPISGTAKIHLTASDKDGNELICGDATVKISKTMYEDSLLSQIPAHVEALTVNSMGSTWKAGLNERFAHATLADVAQLCGANLEKEAEMAPPVKEIEVAANLPTNFNAVENWPECAGVIGHIRDQATCGSCWAFGTVESFNDRLCIATGGKFQTLLSTADITECCGFLQCQSMGCNGGQPSAAWKYLTTHGVVTGGDYDDNGKDDTCKPYFFDTCSHHVNNPKIANCTGEGSTPKCTASCSNTAYPVAYADDKIFAKSHYSIRGEQQIMTEIMTNGPVTAALTVYADFPTYKSGVYRHVSGGQLGGHAIKISGWGVENGSPYWLIANSWNPTWGDNGYIKIARGNNECGIEGQVVSGLAK